jgi:hypothetical protein
VVNEYGGDHPEWRRYRKQWSLAHGHCEACGQDSPPESRSSRPTLTGDFCWDIGCRSTALSDDEDGKKKAERAVEGIGFDSDTLLWTGLSKGLETLEVAKEGRMSHMLLLTDGEAKDKPKIMPNLQSYRNKRDKLPCSIHTFGIGYEIDSALLLQVSGFADGSYAFIPDAGFVGTIFVNTISNIMVTMAKDALLTLEAEAPCKILGVMGQWRQQESTDGIVRVSLVTCSTTKTRISFYR